MKRAIVIVLDSAGIGYSKDAIFYGDIGANTLLHIYEKIQNFSLPNLEKLGLSNLLFKKINNFIGSFGIMEEKSKGKDSISGHWEMMGVILDKPFPTYPEGFPEEMLTQFETLIKRKTIGNYPASGTEIIQKLGEEHLKTGYPIVYTSADSVFQIAAHKDVIPLNDLYQMCEIAREKVCIGENEVARVIARPFIGTPGKFTRTPERRDFALKPKRKSVLDAIKEAGFETVAVGKTYDLFDGAGFTNHYHTENNEDGIKKIIEVIKSQFKGIIYTNLVDFDMIYGHRRDLNGYGNALKTFDSYLPSLFKVMQEEDLLFITADHGCDPTFLKHTDHTREFVPIIVYGKKAKSGTYLGIRNSFSDLGKTISEYLEINFDVGESFLKEIF